MDAFFKLIAAGPLFFVSAWLLMLFAENYARALWRMLALVSVRGSIHYVVLPGLRRDMLLDQPQVLEGATADAEAWWRLTEVG